ncbi:hypothetical protein GCM10010329_09970 [Streptomyces spiroverticillatus]|uniref:Uncharacterized protein n=1 Tax=Streptomyces finlayi TaxID=67296 RepID=A0A919CA40_9ACTN|nr:hypothetical protein [Streptomyces finlayi]GGZ91564.1 hypothetical protein GCM10010329_09970 [Streptomyces spiroverticillatus]GHC93718.1 hypothetical protein GCM10010334_31110 [Streptomyces finlayi]
MAARVAGLTLGVWGVLLVLLLVPLVLPTAWHYYIYSPASVGLWMISMVVTPAVACAYKWEWIRAGGK